MASLHSPDDLTKRLVALRRQVAALRTILQTAQRSEVSLVAGGQSPATIETEMQQLWDAAKDLQGQISAELTALNLTTYPPLVMIGSPLSFESAVFTNAPEQVEAISVGDMTVFDVSDQVSIEGTSLNDNARIVVSGSATDVLSFGSVVVAETVTSGIKIRLKER